MLRERCGVRLTPEERNQLEHLVRAGSSPARVATQAHMLLKTDALLDRLTHHVHILEMNGESYRLKRSRENAASQASEEPHDA